MTSDSGRFIALSESLTQRREFGLVEESVYEPEGWRLPGYPLFIALSRMIAGGSNWGIVVAQSALFLASVWMIYKVAGRIFGAWTGFCFLTLSLIYPFVAYNVGQISAEIPVVFFVSLAFYALSEPTTARVAVAAASVALSAYFRPNLSLLNVALAVGLLWLDRRNYRKALIMIAIAVVIAMPWAVRNYRVFGVFSPMPIIKGSGTSLLLATWQSRVSTRSLIEYGMTGNFTEETQRLGMADQIRNLNREIGVPEDSVMVSPEHYIGNRTKLIADAVFTKAALSNIKNFPGAYLKGCLTNAFRMWFSAFFPKRAPALVGFGLLALGVLVLIFGLCGAAISIRDTTRQKRPALIFFLVIFLYFTSTLCWMHTEARYTIPARLILVLFAARFISWWVERKFTGSDFYRQSELQEAALFL
jgi:4-amino-4-deoxy-L-arabinose transferase-like glycosyltransferase